MFLDVTGIRAYPVFDVHRNAGGRDRKYTFPDESGLRGYTLNRYRVPHDGVLVGTAGHLHPGGLYTDLYLDARRPQRAAVPVAREVLRAGRRRVVGRRDGGDAGGLALSGSRPATS